ncbi:hypothetical protein LCGC14_1757010 [marine sediment metagenome]|uniref:Radical SAM core domain-containing protein n=1 Tax=marine sediment metagenome TaxID=412755 RepID=A0A0F9H292_9ZZZZ
MTTTAKPRLPVAEVFGPTLQGEGALAGLKTMFVRFGYCDGAGDGWCKWCDSLFAVDPKNKAEWRFLTEEEIIAELEALQERPRTAYRHVTLSGGNPALHQLGDFVQMLGHAGYRVHVETQGTVFRDWLCRCDSVTVSPKPPSAGECNIPRFLEFMEKLTDARLRSGRLILKIVVDPDNEQDYEFARALAYRVEKLYSRRVERYLSVVTIPSDTCDDLLMRYRRLADRVVADPDFLDVSVLPQLHVLLWGHKRGV